MVSSRSSALFLGFSFGSRSLGGFVGAGFALVSVLGISASLGVVSDDVIMVGLICFAVYPFEVCLVSL